MRALLYSIYGFALLTMCLYLQKSMYYDFDILMYTACVLEDGKKSPEDLHKSTYEMAQASLPQDKWQRLTDSSNFYRHQLHTHPEKFTQQIPFYKIKPLYVWLLKVGYYCGFTPFLFSVWINLFCYVLLGLLLMRYLQDKLEFKIAYLAAFCLMFLPMVLDTVRNNTPDMLATVLFVAAVLPMLSENKRQGWSTLIFMLLLILVRAESFLFLAILCGFLFKNQVVQNNRKYLLVLLLAGLTIFLFVMIAYRGYGWALLYRHSFLGYIADLSSAPAGLTIKEYLLGFKNIPRGFFISDFSLLLALLLLVRFYQKGLQTKLDLFAKVCLCFIACRLVLFPDISIRFFTALFMLAYILFFEKFFAKKTV